MDRTEAAKQAIENAGGAASLARAIGAETGVELTTDRVRKWSTIGVPYRWASVVATLTGVPRSVLAPEPGTQRDVA